MSDSGSKALVPLEQKQVQFYDDTITAVLLIDGQVLIPLRPICDFLGIDWSGQRQRILRNQVLSEVVKPCMVITPTQGQPDQRREVLAIPLDYLAGWLFTIQPNRVKSHLQDKILQYQRECYLVLAEAFNSGRLTADPALAKSGTPAAQAYQIAMAVADLARNQMLLEERTDDHQQRIEQLEEAIAAPGSAVTPDQASQISQSVKAVAMILTKTSGSNQYGAVYGEMYRKFGITSYKLLPASRFQEAIDWLTEWHAQLTGEEPF